MTLWWNQWVGGVGERTYSAIGVFSLSNNLSELNHIALKAGLDKRHLCEGREREREIKEEGEMAGEKVARGGRE